MAQSSFPFENVDTTETQFSQMFRTLNAGVNGTPAGTELKVSAGTGLQVSVALGQAMVRGHYYISTATELLTIGTANPSNPRIDTVVLRLDPVANSIVLAVVAGTAAASPVAPTLTQTDAGVFEFPLANVAVAAGAGTVGTITDRRVFMGKRLQSVGTSAARDIMFPTPVQGDMVWRDDLGALETYFGLASVSNPGGRDAAGWYVTNRSSSLVTIKPTSVDKSGGTATISALGRVDFSTVAYVSLNGVFTSAYNRYRIIISDCLGSVNITQWNIRLRTSGADNTAANYVSTWQKNKSAVSLSNGALTYYPIMETSSSYNYGSTIIDIQSPAAAFARSTIMANSVGYDGTVFTGYLTHGMYATLTAFDGISFIASSGTISGKIAVFGWNE